MPQYQVTDPTDGTKLVLTGDSPPTEDELGTVFRQHKMATIQEKIRSRMPGGETSSPLAKDFPLTGVGGAVQPSLTQSLEASAPGEMAYGAEMGLLGAGQFLAHAGEKVIGGDQLKDITQRGDAAMAERSRGQKLARNLSGTDVLPAWSNPGEAIGQTAVTAPMVGALGGSFKPAATMMGRFLEGAGTGAGLGSVAPVTDQSQPYWKQNIRNTLLGATAGGALPVLGAAAEKLTTPSDAAPTTVQLKSSAGYKQFAQNPITLTPEASSALSDNVGRTAIQQAMEEAQINREPHLVNEFKGLLELPSHEGVSVTTEAADKIRQAMDSLAKDAGTPNAARGWASRSDALEGAIQQTPEINAARNTWAQFRKSEIIDKTIAAATEAQGTPAGFGDSAQAIKREFLKLARSQKFNSFSDEEQKAITDVANGTLTTNTLQRLGKLSPVKSHLTGLLELGGGALGLGTSLIPGGAIPAVGLAVAGEAARQGSNYATSRAARLASELVRRGGSPSAVSPITNELRALTSAPVSGLTAAAMARLLSQPTPQQ